MTIDRFFVRTVTIVTPAMVDDRRGTSVKDWDNATRTEAPRGWLAQRSATEQRGDREAQLSTWVLSLPAGTAVTGLDRVEVDGTTYEVNGEIGRPWTPTGEHHVVVPLERVSG